MNHSKTAKPLDAHVNKSKFPTSSLGKALIEYGHDYTNAKDFVNAWMEEQPNAAVVAGLDESPELIARYLTACLSVDGNMLAVAFRYYSLNVFTLAEIYTLTGNHDMTTDDLEEDAEQNPFSWKDQLKKAITQS